MKEELEYSLTKLRKASLKLKQGTLKAKDELERDGVIQRFEFTFELLWKTLKLFLRAKGMEARTPKDCFKEAFRVGWLKEEEIFAHMLEDRNKSSHVYDEAESKEIFGRIKDQYIECLEKALMELEKSLDEK